MKIIETAQQREKMSNDDSVRSVYETPLSEIQKLSLITKGGTPGAGDSGDPTALAPFGTNPT